MIFQFTYQAVIEGQKTQTRRIVKPDDRFTMALASVVIGKDAGSVIQTVPTSIRALSQGSCVHAVWSGKRVKWQVGHEYAVQSARTAKGIARIRITDIRCEQVGDITEDDARCEGFADRDEFLRVFKTINPKTDLNTEVWVLTFELVKP